MECPKCKTDNEEPRKFCRKCGRKLSIICPDCGFENLPEDVFCGGCGCNLKDQEESPLVDYNHPESYTPKFLADKILTSRGAIEGERKQVTVLFADVANYTSMSEQLDPEEVHQIMDGCFNILMEEIHKYEGTINQFTGDGVMALFGAPVAHEDHAQRACYAALSIQRVIGEYGEKVAKDTGTKFKMRLGLNSGPVIVGSIGDDLRMDYTAVGDTTNLAARIQQIAKPGQVWLSQKTHSIVKDYFQDELAEETSLKGKSQPQSIYRIISERPGVRTRFQAGMVRGITELVGRRSEMEGLKSALQKAQDGEGQVVDVVGEAGVGKSRLVYEFQKAFEQDVIFMTGNCVQYGQNMNYLPVIDILKDAFEIEEGMTEDQIGHKIKEEATKDLAQMIPFYRSLLSLKIDDQKFNALEPEGRKFGTFEAMKDLMITLSKQRPLVVFLEDVHWIDKISEALLTYFARCTTDHPILMLSAYRPEGAPTWAQGAHYQRLGLETLSSKSSIKLVRNMLNVIALDPALEKKIAEKTEGNPFFVEEIVRELFDRGDIVKSGDQYTCARPIEECEIPNTVQGVLAARMDRLSEDLKMTMQVASVIGRDFVFRILKSIMELGEELRTQMTNLVGLEILYEKTLYPELEYIFKHALTQEVAYESLLKQRRREIHGRVARTIEELYSDKIEEYYESLAHHYERSGNAVKAVNYLILAGEKSNRIGAIQAGSEFLEKAHDISVKENLTLNPATEVRLYYQKALAHSGKGAVGESVKGYRRALDISRTHNMIDYERDSLRGLTFHMRAWPNREEADRFFSQSIARAQEIGDKGLECHILCGMCMRTHGDYGQRHKAEQIITEAETLAHVLEDPGSIATVRYTRGVQERFFGRPRKMVKLSEGLIEKTFQMFNVVFLSILIMHRGAALAEIGDIEEGMETIRNGIEICEKFGVLYMLGALYNCLGYCYSEIHQHKQALKFNLKSEEISLKLYEKYPMGRLQSVHILGQAEANLVENFIDQGDLDKAWGRANSKNLKMNTKGITFNRYQWESRMKYYSAQILLRRNDINQAEVLIEEHLDKVRKDLMRKREGSFLRLLGEVQTKRNESDNAITTLNESIQILQEVENPRQLWQAHCSLALVFEKMERRSEAQEQWGAASDIIQNIAAGLTDRELREGFLNAETIREILSKVVS